MPVIDAQGTHRRARPHRHARPSARAGRRPEGDHRHRHARGGGGRLHQRPGHAEHESARGRPEHHRAHAPARARDGLRQRLHHRLHHRRHEGRAARAHRLAPQGGVVAHHRRRPLRAEQRGDAPRARLRPHVRPAHARPLPGLQSLRRRRDARGLLEHRAGPARLAAHRGGHDRRAQHPALGTDRRAHPRAASFQRRLGAARARGEEARREDFRRGDAAPPRPHRRRHREATTPISR